MSIILKAVRQAEMRLTIWLASGNCRHKKDCSCIYCIISLCVACDWRKYGEGFRVLYHSPVQLLPLQKRGCYIGTANYQHQHMVPDRPFVTGKRGYRIIVPALNNGERQLRPELLSMEHFQQFLTCLLHSNHFLTSCWHIIIWYL